MNLNLLSLLTGRATVGPPAEAAAAGIPVSVVWSSEEPSTWTLDVTDKDDNVTQLSNASPTANLEFTQDGATYHAYAFEFTQEGFEILNSIAVNGSNGINYEYITDTQEGGDPDSTPGTGITIHSGSSSLVFTIDIA